MFLLQDNGGIKAPNTEDIAAKSMEQAGNIASKFGIGSH
jgi:hypothetical protein